ncbi:hypothetical protein A2159_03680 [Candidatus Woesebacteria bacterium RBG_13_34_9]|uniref:Uncharacterized protein n=1 Tax=Candidatus Woesebacteria bacterium RBG_13_34_9 TaxID=1802477 RepID=A0A1F7X0L6_9BACT|nr:MAG: hypothetical protein A2159_03680 [Candidatus Woesebacteria bacterium RBG_13_34_9]
MTKNRKIIISSFLLTVLFVTNQFFQGNEKYIAIAILGIFVALTFYWSLKEGINLNATLLTFILPIFFSIGSGLFWLLLPANIITRILVVISFLVGIYAIFKTENIFTVAVMRRIPLTRAAKGIGFALTLTTCSFIMGTIFSFRREIFFNGILVFLLSFPLFLQGYWSSLLTLNIPKKLIIWSLVSSFSLAQVALVLYFWPISVFVASLFLTICVYVALGLGQLELEERLFFQNIREYLVIGILVFFIIFIFGARWGG